MKKNLLKFCVCGSVDDGKSTLIGRLLYDTKSLFQDQILELQNQSLHQKEMELAYLTDGLRAEREQGITIDVAYRYFSTPHRRFTIIDTPGHFQYTKNMVTGASNSELAVIMVNAQLGLVEQTKRHAAICSILGIKNIIVCINKMDLVSFSEQIFTNIKSSFLALNSIFNFSSIYFIPTSAKDGINIVHSSEKLTWYKGLPLLNLLESIEVNPEDSKKLEGLLQVQGVIRSHSHEQKILRAFSGQVQQGYFNIGDEVTIYPSGLKSKIINIYLGDQSLKQVHAKQSVAVQLEDELDISRGDLITTQKKSWLGSSSFAANLCWLHEQSWIPAKKYHLQLGVYKTQAKVDNIKYLLDISTFDKKKSETIRVNDISHVQIKTAKSLYFLPYKENKNLGAFILIDPDTHQTVAAGMILSDEGRAQ